MMASDRGMGILPMCKAVAGERRTETMQTRTDGVSQADAQEILKAFDIYKQACKNRDMNGYAMAFDALSRQKVNAQELPAEEPEMLDMIAAATIDRIAQAKTTSEKLGRDVIKASDGDLKWYFAKSPEGWKIVIQRFSYDSGALVNLIRHQRQHDPQGAVQIPDRTPSPADVDEIRRAFQRYQDAIRTRDIEAIAELSDLQGKAPVQYREAIRFGLDHQDLWQAITGVQIDLVRIRKAVKFSDEWLDMVSTQHPGSGTGRIPRGKGPYYYLYADDVAIYYRKTPEGLKRFTTDLDVD